MEAQGGDAIDAAESVGRADTRERVEHGYAGLPRVRERRYEEVAALRDERGDAAFLED